MRERRVQCVCTLGELGCCCINLPTFPNYTSSLLKKDIFSDPVLHIPNQNLHGWAQESVLLLCSEGNSDVQPVFINNGLRNSAG